MTTLRFTLPVLLIVFAELLSAQSAGQRFKPYTIAFRLDDADATSIARNPKLTFSESWLHTLADTLFESCDWQHLPAGAYLLIHGEGETLEAEFFLSNALQVNLLNTGRDFAFVLLDSLGNN